MPSKTQQHTMVLLPATLEERGGSLLLVTHDPTRANKLADRCIDVGPRRLVDRPAR